MKHDDDPGAWVLSIHDRDPRGFLAFDLRDILECLLPTIASYTWVAFDLNFSGPSFITEGELLATNALLEASRKTAQTIDGHFVAYDERVDEATVMADRSRSFPQSRAVLEVVAVDSTLFDVLTKKAADVDLIKSRFSDVREEDTSQYW
jgi:hypothetical protein